MRRTVCLWLGVAVACAVAGGCRGDSRSRGAAETADSSAGTPASSAASESGPAGPYEWQLPAGSLPPAVPAGNPMTAAKVELGRHLFYDPRLSHNNSRSCAFCHMQDLGFADGVALSRGATGQKLPRNSPGLQNVAYFRTLTWNNHLLVELERQIPVPLFSETPVELGWTGHDREILDRLGADERYQRLFAAAFPDKPTPTVGHVLYSLSAFVRSMVSFDSPYDRYRRGDSDALTESARRGLELFESERLGCRGCHGGPNFSMAAPADPARLQGMPAVAGFANVGLYDVDGEGSYPAENPGLFELTRRPQDQGKMRVPGPRNVALTAPYRHDGSVATLDEVIREYEAGGRGPGAGGAHKDPRVGGFALSDDERADLVAFLASLTDQSFVEDPRFSNPMRGR